MSSVESSVKKLKFSDDKNTRKKPYDVLKNTLTTYSHMPHVVPGMSNAEVQRRTGFASESNMLSRAALLCNGDLDEMLASKSKLTWFEE